MADYPINKGIGHSVEFKGLKAQYLFIFAGGLLAAGQTHQNYSDKNCNISNCKTLIINVLDLLILDIFRNFIV